MSIVLFSIGGLFALYEARHKWSDPNRLLAMGPIAVLLLAMAMEAYAREMNTPIIGRAITGQSAFV